MRDYKFRGVDKYGVWVYGSLVNNLWELNKDKTPICEIITNGRNYYDCWDDIVSNDNIVEVISESVGQFTGLFDKNGKEIYEGDIVNAFWPHKDEIFGVSNVVFQSGCFMLEWIDDKEANMELAGMYYKTGRPRVLEITGNIYDQSNQTKVT